MGPLFRFAYFRGMGMSEFARLRWRHVDLEKRLVYIYERKNKKELTIPLAWKAADVLRSVRRGELDAFVFRSPGVKGRRRSVRRFVEHAYGTFGSAREAAGIDRQLTPHCLRHSFCTGIAEAGKSAVLIKEVARHADVQTSMMYVHLAGSYLCDEIDEVFS